MDDTKVYPELLFYRTKVKKKTVKDTIKGLNMSVTTYLRVEKGKRELTLDEALIIANNLEVSLNTLFPKIFLNQKLPKSQFK